MNFIPKTAQKKPWRAAFAFPEPFEREALPTTGGTAHTLVPCFALCRSRRTWNVLNGMEPVPTSRTGRGRRALLKRRTTWPHVR